MPNEAAKSTSKPLFGFEQPSDRKPAFSKTTVQIYHNACPKPKFLRVGYF